MNHCRWCGAELSDRRLRYCPPGWRGPCGRAWAYRHGSWTTVRARFEEFVSLVETWERDNDSALVRDRGTVAIGQLSLARLVHDARQRSTLLAILCHTMRKGAPT